MTEDQAYESLMRDARVVQALGVVLRARLARLEHDTSMAEPMEQVRRLQGGAHEIRLLLKKVTPVQPQRKDMRHE